MYDKSLGSNGRLVYLLLMMLWNTPSNVTVEKCRVHLVRACERTSAGSRSNRILSRGSDYLPKVRMIGTSHAHFLNIEVIILRR